MKIRQVFPLMVMLLGSKIIFRYVDWWSIAFLLLCSTKFLAGDILPVQENEDLLKELENNLQESYNDNQESEKDLQEADGNFEVQPRVIF